MSLAEKVQSLFGLKRPKHRNEFIRRMLRKQGQSIRKTRLVDHRATFQTKGQADAFKTFVKYRGYEIVDTDEDTAVAFQRESKIVGADFDRETDILAEQAEDLYGQYDGFGNVSLR